MSKPTSKIIHLCDGICILVSSVKMIGEDGSEDTIHAYQIVNSYNGTIYDKFYRRSSDPVAFFRLINFKKKKYILTNSKYEYVTLINLSDKTVISRAINIMGKRARPIKCEKIKADDNYVAIIMRCSIDDDPKTKILDGGSNVKVITILIDDMDKFALPDHIIVE